MTCSCKCGHVFCFDCGDSPHGSIPCKLMHNWKANSNDLNIEYFTKYTKECPKCHSVIEKDGGCNRVICKKCQHPFCWLCYGPMVTYEHQCNQYKDTDSDRTNKKRWQHYFMRYKSHKASLEYEQSMKNCQIKDRMKDLQATGKSWNEVNNYLAQATCCNVFKCFIIFFIFLLQVQFLANAIDILCESRRQLMQTYIFAYYVEEQNQKTIFETNQSDLESATEALSQYLEQQITKDNVEEIMHKVMDKSR